jgi:bifunctional DNA-binding transcriptional regulator/antitoxin component of YhaV-PrlF toxin-antitoxin module
MSLESTVGIAKVGTKSLRATIPKGIVAFLGIEEGDKLEWRMDIQNENRMATVQKKGSNIKSSLELARQSMKQKKKRGDPL